MLIPRNHDGAEPHVNWRRAPEHDPDPPRDRERVSITAPSWSALVTMMGGRTCRATHRRSPKIKGPTARAIARRPGTVLMVAIGSAIALRQKRLPNPPRHTFTGFHNPSLAHDSSALPRDK